MGPTSIITATDLSALRDVLLAEERAAKTEGALLTTCTIEAVS